jgi:hypothetical protein
LILSDVSVTRPVLASVLSLLLIAFGLLAFDRLPLREYPDIDPPVVSIDTVYPGASANVVETRITQLIEDRVSGVEGIRTIESVSEDGRSRITIEFDIDRDIDGAANDVRDRVSGILDQLPVEAEPPDIQKVDSNEDVIMWLNLASERMTVPFLGARWRGPGACGRQPDLRHARLDRSQRPGGAGFYRCRRGERTARRERGIARGRRGVAQQAVQCARGARLQHAGTVRPPRDRPRR